MEENNSNQNPAKFDPRAVVEDLKQATRGRLTKRIIKYVKDKIY